MAKKNYHPYQNQPEHSDGHNTPGDPGRRGHSGNAAEKVAMRESDRASRCKSTAAPGHPYVNQPEHSEGHNLAYQGQGGGLAPGGAVDDADAD